MRKIVVHRPGSHDALVLEEHPSPVPAACEVRVRVAATGVNFADTAVRMGLYSSARKYVGWPITPGFEYAGTIDAVGSSVTKHKIGDEIFGVTRFGGYASEIVVPEHQVFQRPAELTIEQAAGFLAVYLSAWFGLIHLANARRGETVLVHSAAGGVGTATLQLCRSTGCRGIGVVGSTHKIDVARDFGAADVIDKSSTDLFAEAERLSPGGYDVVMDPNGAETLKDSYEHLAPAGRLVIYGFHSMMSKTTGRPNWPKIAYDWLRTPRFNPFEMTDKNRSVLAFNVSYLFERADILAIGVADLAARLARHEIRGLPVQTFPLDRVADAHRAIESGQTVGKLVLIP